MTVLVSDVQISFQISKSETGNLCIVLCLKVSNESITWTELFLQVVPIASSGVKHNRPLWVAVQGLIRPTPYTYIHSSGVCPPHHDTKLIILRSVSTGMLWDSEAHRGLEFWTSKFV
jgi:hypothetical protein